MKFWLHVVLLIPLLPGCQINDHKHDFTYLSNSLPKGSVIQLNHPLVVPKGTSRTCIQDGIRFFLNDISIFEPWCQFKLYEPQVAMNKERTIQPDRFTVVSVSKQEGLVQTTPIMVAARFDDYWPSSKSLATTYRLTSEIQPEVYEFQCSSYSIGTRHDYISIEEMKKTLGDIVTIHVEARDRRSSLISH